MVSALNCSSKGLGNLNGLTGCVLLQYCHSPSSFGEFQSWREGTLRRSSIPSGGMEGGEEQGEAVFSYSREL